MPEATKTLRELKSTLAARDLTGREQAVHRIADLFIADADRLAEEHVALFDQVLGLLTDAIEARTRARLAERLADIPNAPPDLMRRLSRDMISVARPVLVRSPRLSDGDLVAAARAGGRDHMLAISERRQLAEPVTDVLISEGDRVVVNAVASNPGARFSSGGYDRLVERAKTDALLQVAVGRRSDIPPRHMAALFELAKVAARERLSDLAGKGGGKVVAKAVAQSARDIAAETKARSDAFMQAMQAVTALMQDNALGEEALVAYARTGRLDETVVALSYLGKVPLAISERALLSDDTDMLLVVARAADFEWSSVRDLCRARPMARPSPNELQRLQETYGRLTRQTAERVLRFMLARESAAAVRG